MDLEKTLLRKVGEAISRFKMIRDGDRVAVGLSGGKDSITLLEALLLLQKRAPIDFSVCAFTIEQGKFLAPFEPMGEYMKSRSIDWTYVRDGASFDLLEEQPDHGCDMCSRYRRRASYDVVRRLGANVVAFGHTADDFAGTGVGLTIVQRIIERHGGSVRGESKPGEGALFSFDLP